MSSLEIYTAGTDGTVSHYADCRNSWGGAIHIWNVYATQLGIIEAGDPSGIGRLLMNGYEAVWQRTSELPEADQWVMRGTFDRVMIPLCDLPTYRKHLDAFLARHSTRTLVELTMELNVIERNNQARAVCFNWTSVSENPWYVYDGTNIDEYGDDGGRPYNIDRDRKHWWINAIDEPLSGGDEVRA